MSQIQFIQITPEEHEKSLLSKIDARLDRLSKHFQPKEPTEYLGRDEVAKLLKVGITTVHNWTVNGTLTSYQIGRRILYKRAEVEAAIVKLEK